MDELSAEVEVLESKLLKTSELTAKISLSLQKLSASAKQVEEAVKPIYGKTQALTVVSSNIDNAINAIDRVRQPSGAVSEEEGTIRNGPSESGLSTYLASLTRVNDSLSKLKKSNLRSSQKAVQQMTGLLKAGSLQLEDLFQKTLVDESASIEPLHYLTKDIQFPRFHPQKANTLALLNDYLSSTLAVSSGLQSNATQIYSDVRGPYITSSLSSLALATSGVARRSVTTSYEKGSNGIGMYTKSLEGIFEAEYENICQIFPSQVWSTVYNSTISSAMAAFKLTIQDLNAFISKNMATDLFLTFEIIECVQPASVRLKSKTGEQRDFTEALKPIRQTAQSSFNFMIEDLKRSTQAILTLPADSSVGDVTTETCARIRKVSEYQSAVSGLLISLGDGNWKRTYSPQNMNISNFDVGADGTLLISHFIVDMIDILIHEIEQKAMAILKKKSNIAVFMINNVAFIENMIRRSDVSKLMTATAHNKVEKWRKDAIKMYMEGWKECAAFLMDVTYTKQHASGKSMSSKEKESVKDKFKSFNGLFDDMVQKHRGYNIPDKEIRQMLNKEIGFIGPLYGRFYEKYKDVINPKYLKYERQVLDGILTQL